MAASLITSTRAMTGMYVTRSGSTYYVYNSGWIRETKDGSEMLKGIPVITEGALHMENINGDFIANSTEIVGFAAID
jgi:hypothetical protein